MSVAPPRLAGLALCAVQFFLALSWTVYVLFLPQLAAQAGIPKTAVIYILMLDQAVFLFVDFAAGVAADRVAHQVHRLGMAILAATGVSCLAFLLLPIVAPHGSVLAFIAITALWSVTSSALRAPPLALMGRYMDRRSQPGLVALSLFGLGLATAIAPYLGLALRQVDPRWPFALSSLALALATLGIVWAERALSRASGPARALDDVATPPPPGATRWLLGLLSAALLAAVAFQLHVFLNSLAAYRRFVGEAGLAPLVPVFWIGFNLFLLPASMLSRRLAVHSVMGASAVVAALAAALAHQTTSLPLLLAAQVVAGAAWACLMMSAFAAALAIGRSGRQGRFTGALSSMLALAALLRLAVVAAQAPQPGAAEALLRWAPSVAWVLAAALLFALWRHGRLAGTVSR